MISTQQSQVVSYAGIVAAAERLRGVAHKTPVLTSRQVNAKLKAEVFFKCENFQRVGAFKFRGAYNAIAKLTEAQRQQGVVAASSGNHAQAVALVAKLLDIKATIIMPHDAPAVKLQATKGYGAEVRIYQRGREDREAIMRQMADEQGVIPIPAFDHPDIIAGQGTAAKELIEEAGALDYLFVCIGGGGLMSGSSIAAKANCPKCILIGVEPEAGNDAQQSFRSGKIVEIDVPKTIADGAMTQSIGHLALPILQANVQDIVTVSDEQLKAQMRFFAERMKMIVEPTGCLAAAAVMNGDFALAGKRVGVIVSGGNVDLASYARYISNVI